MRKGLDIKEEITNKRNRIHYIDGSLREQLDEILNSKEIIDLLKDNRMMYNVVYDDAIILILFKSLDYLIKSPPTN